MRVKARVAIPLNRYSLSVPSALTLPLTTNLPPSISISISGESSCFGGPVQGCVSAGAAGAIQTGLALTNPSTAPLTINISMTRLDGSSLGLTGSVTVPASGQTALFLNQIPGFSGLPQNVQGVLRISAPSNVAVVGLRGRYNERGEFLITTTPPVGEDETASTTELVFPHILEGGGYTTQFTLFSGTAGQASAGSLRFYNQAGQPMRLSLQ